METRCQFRWNIRHRVAAWDRSLLYLLSVVWVPSLVPVARRKLDTCLVRTIAKWLEALVAQVIAATNTDALPAEGKDFC